jgi:hypothetical protein
MDGWTDGKEYQLNDSDRKKTNNTVSGDSTHWDEQWAPHVVQHNASRAHACARHSNLLSHARKTDELRVTAVISRLTEFTICKAQTS